MLKMKEKDANPKEQLNEDESTGLGCHFLLQLGAKETKISSLTALTG